MDRPNMESLSYESEIPNTYVCGHRSTETWIYKIVDGMEFLLNIWRNILRIRNNSQTTYVDKILAFFDHSATTLGWYFISCEHWKKSILLDHLPTPLVIIVCEEPLIDESGFQWLLRF